MKLILEQMTDRQVQEIRLGERSRNSSRCNDKHRQAQRRAVVLIRHRKTLSRLPRTLRVGTDARFYPRGEQRRLRLGRLDFNLLLFLRHLLRLWQVDAQYSLIEPCLDL